MRRVDHLRKRRAERSSCPGGPRAATMAGCRCEPPARSLPADRDRAGCDDRNDRIACRRGGRPPEVGSPRHPVPRVPVRPHGGQHRHRAPGVRRDPRPLRPDQRRQPRLADHHVVLHRRRHRSPVLRTVLRSLRTRAGPAGGDGCVCTRRTGRHARAVDDRTARLPLRVGPGRRGVWCAAGGDRPRPLRGEPDGARDVGRHGGVPHRAGDRTDDR